MMEKCILLAVLVVLAVCTQELHAKKSNRNREDVSNSRMDGHPKERKQSLENCTWEYEACIPKGDAKCGVGTKKGKAIDNNKCPVPEKTFKCKVPCGCRYKPRKDSAKHCDPETNKMEVTQILISGDRTKCAETKLVQRTCKQQRGARDAKAGRRQGADGAELRAKQMTTTTAVSLVAVPEPVAPHMTPVEVPSNNNMNNNLCKYRKGTKSECDPETRKRTVTMHLKKKSPSTCEPTKTILKDCKVKEPRQPRRGKGAKGF